MSACVRNVMDDSVDTFAISSVHFIQDKCAMPQVRFICLRFTVWARLAALALQTVITP